MLIKTLLNLLLPHRPGRVEIVAFSSDKYCIDEDYSEDRLDERMTYKAFLQMAKDLEGKFQEPVVWSSPNHFELPLPGKIMFVGIFFPDAEYLATEAIGCQALQPCLAAILTDIESHFGEEFDHENQV